MSPRDWSSGRSRSRSGWWSPYPPPCNGRTRSRSSARSSCPRCQPFPPSPPITSWLLSLLAQVAGRSRAARSQRSSGLRRWTRPTTPRAPTTSLRRGCHAAFSMQRPLCGYSVGVPMCWRCGPQVGRLQAPTRICPASLSTSMLTRLGHPSSSVSHPPAGPCGAVLFPGPATTRAWRASLTPQSAATPLIGATFVRKAGSARLSPKVRRSASCFRVAAAQRHAWRLSHPRTSSSSSSPPLRRIRWSSRGMCSSTTCTPAHPSRSTSRRSGRSSSMTAPSPAPSSLRRSRTACRQPSWRPSSSCEREVARAPWTRWFHAC
mmetsp:Transcript_60596/g.190485  ORF Transcript_60596/g.190485 Transcript_60596/m.190485 type:complete len:319 (+) Transcript_60596:131-1087(+)